MARPAGACQAPRSNVQQRLVFFVLAFLVVVVLILGSGHYYVWMRLVRAPAWGGPWQRAGGIAVLALYLGLPVGIVVSRVVARPVGRILAEAAYLWLGVLMLLVLLLGASELLRAAVLLGRRIWVTGPAGDELHLLVHRIRAAVVVVLALAGTVVGRLQVAADVPIVRVRLELARWPRAMNGFRLVQLSDLHLGDSIDGRWLERVVARANSLDADAVVITGDFADGSVAQLGPEAAAIGALHAKQGVYFVTGNHEYYSGLEPWLRELASHGIRTLQNERTELTGPDGARVDLVGVNDSEARGSADGPDLAKALAGRDPHRAVVLLAHQPREIVAAAAQGVDLQLSGHTHGGQIFPWPLAVRLQQPYVAGLIRHAGTWLYVSRGTGYWGPPMRLGAPPEITLFEISAPSDAASAASEAK